MDWGGGALGGEIQSQPRNHCKKRKGQQRNWNRWPNPSRLPNKKGMVEGEEELFLWPIVAFNSINHFYISVNLDFRITIHHLSPSRLPRHLNARQLFEGKEGCLKVKSRPFERDLLREFKMLLNARPVRLKQVLTRTYEVASKFMTVSFSYFVTCLWTLFFLLEEKKHKFISSLEREIVRCVSPQHYT